MSSLPAGRAQASQGHVEARLTPHRPGAPAASLNPDGRSELSLTTRERPRHGLDPQPERLPAYIATCEQCSDEFDLAGLDRRTALCADCFDSYVHDLETPFLENYAAFSGKAHRTVAEALFRGLVLADPTDRKVMGMRIVEEYLAAAEEFMGLYLALRGREARPVVKSFMEFRLNAATLTAFLNVTQGWDNDWIMRDLGLPTIGDVESARTDIPKRQYKQFRAAVTAVSSGLSRVAKVEHGALLHLSEGLRESQALADRVDWVPDRSMNPDQVALLVLDQRRRTMATHALAIHEPQLERFIDAIGRITAAARDMVWLYLHMRDVERALD